MKLTLVVAVSENGVIGREGGLPWRLSDDLRRFKRLTMGACMIMGRKTYDSIGRPLPGRRSLVLTRQPAQESVPESESSNVGVRFVPTLDAALEVAAKAGLRLDVAFVVGGAEVYRLALPRADRVQLTRVHAIVEGDTTFPDLDPTQWELIDATPFAADAKNDHAVTLETYERRTR